MKKLAVKYNVLRSSSSGLRKEKLWLQAEAEEGAERQSVRSRRKKKEVQKYPYKTYNIGFALDTWHAQPSANPQSEPL